MKRSELYSNKIASDVEAVIVRHDQIVMRATGDQIAIFDSEIKVKTPCSSHAIPYDKIRSITFRSLCDNLS